MKTVIVAVVFVLAGVSLFSRPVAAHAADAPDPAEHGRQLYLVNCAHCHADDATGDEGPDLHRVKKTDARITAIIQKGIKGEMPAFGKKLRDEDVRDLIAYIRSLASEGSTNQPARH